MINQLFALTWLLAGRTTNEKLKEEFRLLTDKLDYTKDARKSKARQIIKAVEIE